MTQFLFRKMLKNKWLMLCLIIGNIFLLGSVIGTPLYINATMRRILHQDLRQFQIENNTHPAQFGLRFVFNGVLEDQRTSAYDLTINNFLPNMIKDLGLPVSQTIRTDTLSAWHILPLNERETNPRARSLEIVGSDFESHINIIQGRMPSNELTDNTIEVIVMETALVRHDLLLNEVLTVRNVNSRLGDLYIQIVGIYEPLDDAGHFWSSINLNYANTMLASQELVQKQFLPVASQDYRIITNWIHLLDYTAMTPRHVPRYIDSLSDIFERYRETSAVWTVTENFSETIQGNIGRTERLAITMWVLQIPMYVLLAFYIYMVSRKILEMEQNDISVLKSRGASRYQILGLYSMQGAIIGVIAFPIGLLLGVLLCHMLGASSGFLYLVNRTALLVEITPQALLYGLIAVALSFMTMFIPVIAFSKRGIVEHKRNKSGQPQASLWQRLYLDLLCLGIAIYGLYTFSNQQETTAITDTQSVDPLIFVSSSLFIMGLGLLCLRLFPLFVKLIFNIGKSFWSPAAYASLIKVIRAKGEEQFIMIFLIFTLAVGTFSAQAARTINLNNDHKIMYISGADLMFREFWHSETPPMGEGSWNPDFQATQVVFFEPDFERFTGFDEVDAMTTVQRQSAFLFGGTLEMGNTVEIMAIETDTFGNTIWFRDDLLAAHVNHFLNVLASTPDGVLLSSSFKNLGYSIGDTISFSNGQSTVRGRIMGFVDYWPGFIPSSTQNILGSPVEVDNYLIIANIGHLQTVWGMQPYQIWMKTNTDSNRFFYDFFANERVNFVEFNDAKNEVIESRQEPILQGMNGVLTVSFILALFICFAGFLIYWILSIRSRILQFGIFRAMGMGMKNLVGLLVGEQILITLTAIILGAIVGQISAGLFVPIIQMSYTASDKIIPLIVATYVRDYINLYTVILIMVIACLFILATYVRKIKIAQALKLGED